MAYPTAIVEVSFVSGPYVQSPTWVDVTSYVREITTRRGRSDEFQDFGAGSCTVVLDNRDRRFDPLNTAGPYYGNLVPRKQIRVRAQITTSGGVVSHDIFRGYVSGWPVSLTDAGFDSTVTVEAFDALGLLQYEEIPDDLADAYIRSLAPLHYWPLTDPADPNNASAFSAADYGSAPLPMVPSSSSIRIGNQDGVAAGLPNTSVYLLASNTAVLASSSSTAGAATNTIAFWSSYFAGFTSQLIVAGYGCDASFYYLDTTTTYTLEIVNSTGTYRKYTASLAVDTNVAHHHALLINSDGTLNTCYIDGIAVTFTLAATSASTASAFDRVVFQNGAKQQCAVWRGTLLTATQVETIYRLSRNILTETTTARFNRLIGYSSFPSGLTSAPASPYASVGAFTTGGPTIASELEIVSDSEGGSLYVSKAGTVTMTGRNQFATGTSLTSQATIGTTGITIGTSLEYRVDAENMRNQLAVGYSGDGSIEVTDSTSVSTYGVAGGSITTQLVTQDDAETLGQFLVGFSKDPAVVISPVEVNVSAVADDWHTVLGLELLDRITFTVQPRTGASFTQQQLIQSIEHRVIPGQWATTLNGSVRFTNPFIIGSSLLGGSDLIL